MVNKNKNIILIILVIAAIFIFMQPSEEKEALKGAQADISSASIGRTFSTTEVKIGTTFTNTYTASGFGGGSWGVLISDTSSGGCSPASINTGFLSPTTSTSETITAPGTAGTCIFGGEYIFAGSTDKTISGPTTVSVCQDACTSGQVGCFSSTTRWTCDTSSVCGVQVNTDCAVFENCAAGICVPDCAATLKPDALSAIVAWSISPSAGTRTTALNSILLWASNC